MCGRSFIEFSMLCSASNHTPSVNVIMNFIISFMNFCFASCFFFLSTIQNMWSPPIITWVLPLTYIVIQAVTRAGINTNFTVLKQLAVGRTLALWTKA